MRIAVMFLAVMALAPAAWADLSIHLQSGNGTPGSTDSAITMNVGQQDAAWGYALTVTDFAAASAGAPAYILKDKHPNWKAHLASAPSAQWISTNASGQIAGNTALYAIDFEIPFAVSSATLDFSFLIDNDLGDALNEGLYVNGQPLVGSKLMTTNPDFFKKDQSFPTFDITSLVTPGTNTLYINAVDTGGPSGLQFAAVIHAVPAPGAMLLGAMGLGLVGWRKRRTGKAKEA